MVYDSGRGCLAMFGGSTNMDELGDTFERDSSGVVWRQVARIGPPARSLHAMAYDSARGRVVLFGGQSLAASTYYGDTWEWTGAEWLEVATAAHGPGARYGTAMAYDAAHGATVMFGGIRTYGAPFGDTWQWDGQHWTQLASTGPAPRNYHAMAFDSARGRTVLFGGRNSTGHGVATTHEWDGASWTQVANSGPSARIWHAMAYDGHLGRTVLFGGSDDLANVLADTWHWNGSAWTAVAATVPEHSMHSMAYDAARQRTVAFGGQGTFVAYDTTLEFDGTRWTPVAPVEPEARNDHIATHNPRNGRMLVFGGTNLAGNVVNSTWEWDRATDVWTGFQGTAPAPRKAAMGCYDSGRDRTVVFGGDDWNFQTFGDTWEWNSAAGTWAPIPTSVSPPPRRYAAMGYHPGRARVLLFGGEDAASNITNDLWEYDGTNWITLPASGPSDRVHGAITYDANRAVLVYYGGGHHVPWGPNGWWLVEDDDTWEYDAYGTFTRVSAAGGPPAHLDARMAHDAARDRIVLFGGTSQYSFDGTATWEWNGTNAVWTQLRTQGLLGRTGHTLVYDPRVGRVSSFGGFVGASGAVDEVHELQLDTPWFGSGCGDPPLGLYPSRVPFLGTTARVAVTNARQGLAFLAVGSRDDMAGTTPLPLALDSVGMPGCSVLQSSELLALPTTPVAPDLATFACAVPNAPILLGISLYLQAWSPAAGENAVQLVTSNGVHWQLGT